MADTTISGLPNASTLTGTERVPMDQAGTTVDASAQAIAALATAASVGLGNVNNTSDADKPLSTAAVAALATKATAAQGAKADTAIQPSDSRLTDARAPLAHTQAASTITGLGGAALLNVGTGTGTVAAGDDSRFAEFKARLDSFRDASTFYVSKRISASDSNNGTSLGEAFLTIGAAVAAANAYVTANPGALARINVGPGRFTEASLPFRTKPGILAQGALQRGTVIEPAAGQELNGFWALDSGCMVADFRFSGHQATGTSSTDSTVGTRAWAVRLNEQANGGAGVYLTASPYVKDCASITAETDAGQAGSTSTGDTGGGVLVDGAACRSDSPIRSIVIYGFTQQNLGGPGAVIRNDAYAELVSFFGLFGTWHVQCETGGQATLSGGGCSEFGIYGLVADGYSPTALYTGSLRVAASAGTLTADVVGMSANRLGSSSRPAAGQIMLLGGGTYVITSSVPITSAGVVVADNAPTRAGYRVNFYNPTAVGLAANVAQGATADFRQRSQISAGCHSANYVGSGTNYSALPWNGGVPVRGNEAVERNYGRVFGLIINDVGDVKVAGGAFAVDGTTGAVTINTSSFNLSGLNAIGPFSRNGGTSTVGNQLQELSNSSALLASTGSADGNTAPTQFAVKSYADNRFLAGLTTTAGQPISVSDTSTQDGLGFWTRTRNLSLILNSANGLAQLNSSSLLPVSLLPAATTSTAGAMSAADKVRLDGMATGATANSPDATLLARANHTGTQPASTVTGLAAVATSGAYADLSGRPALGTAAPLDVAASGNASATQVVKGDDSRLADARTPTAHTQAASTITGLAAVATSGSYSSLTGLPALGTAAPLDAAATGDATATQVVKGNDSRLSDPRTPTAHNQAWSTITGTPITLSGYGITDGFTEARVRSTVLTGFTSGAGTISATDSVLTALQKLAGNVASAGSGSVTSVGLSLPSLFTVTGSPITTNGTLTATLATQTANAVWAGPGSGAAAAPVFRALVAADLPSTAVTAGSYTNSSITVDAQGRLTAASSGAAPVTSVTGTAPISSSGGATPAISIAAATTSAAGSMSATDKTKLDAVASGATNTPLSTAAPAALGTAAVGTSTSAARGDHVHQVPTASDVGLGTTSTPQFTGLGLGTAAVSGWELVANGGMVQNRATVTAASSAYTLDVTAANEFLAGASISGAITVNLSNLASIPSGYLWRGVFTFPVAATAGTISWFPGNTGYTIKWDGGTAMTLTNSETEKVVIEVVGGTTTIEIAAMKGRA